MFNHPKDFIDVIDYIPNYGRWDDLYELFPRKTHDINKVWLRQNNISDDDDR